MRQFGAHMRHEQAYRFVIKHDAQQLYSNEQPYWERCVNCQGLYFNDPSNKGKCPATTRYIDNTSITNPEHGENWYYSGPHVRDPQYHYILMLTPILLTQLML
ncbi:hypothetical protein ACFCVU_24575 [Peribacillus butanolivorans]|uniref:Uncharacterized protein n=1 Tax=Peribacillus butanolivorans TaxID=421767 RepID=A0ABN5N2C4_9BACI|nr:hypothetical protein DTO10_01765 [Peribacillus butanolivorans]